MKTRVSLKYFVNDCGNYVSLEKLFKLDYASHNITWNYHCQSLSGIGHGSEEYRMEHLFCNLFRQMLIFAKRNSDRKNYFKVLEITYHETVKLWQLQQKCITWIEWHDSLDEFLEWHESQFGFMLKCISRKLQMRSEDRPRAVTKYLNILLENEISLIL